jgi:hypothetical protein
MLEYWVSLPGRYQRIILAERESSKANMRRSITAGHF